MIPAARNAESPQLWNTSWCLLNASCSDFYQLLKSNMRKEVGLQAVCWLTCSHHFLMSQSVKALKSMFTRTSRTTAVWSHDRQQTLFWCFTCRRSFNVIAFSVQPALIRWREPRGSRFDPRGSRYDVISIWSRLQNCPFSDTSLWGFHVVVTAARRVGLTHWECFLNSVMSFVPQLEPTDSYLTSTTKSWMIDLS